MTYIEGFVAPVPTANKEEYRQHAAASVPLFKEYGVARQYEAWGDDLPKGTLTDFQGAVQATDDETVVFAFFEYPDKATRDCANEKMIADPRMKEMGEAMPFDGKRMIMGGFETILDQRVAGTVGYIDGYLVPVPGANKDAYRELAQKMATRFTDLGALRVVEAWGDDIPDGTITDFKRAVKAQAGENVVYSYVEWPDKAARDAGWARLMADPDMQDEEMPFDGKRMFWGGFKPILDTATT